MKIISTHYQHKIIHRGTWISPDGNTLNQRDHVIVDANKKGVVEDVRTVRGLNCDSDHFLVKTVTKQKLIRTQNNAVKQKKWNQSNFQNPAKIKQYRSCLYNKLIGKEIQQDTEEEWKNIKETITESANEVIQTQNNSNRNEWWDELCKLIMTQ
jgi:predicted choloylglycine hydrolase